MAIREISITEARQALTALPEQLAGQDGALAVTRHGKPVLALMPWELYEALTETIEVMGDRKLMEALRTGLAQARRGELVSWEEVRAELER